MIFEWFKRGVVSTFGGLFAIGVTYLGLAILKFILAIIVLLIIVA